MTDLVLNLSEWYKIKEVSKALIDPNTYYRMTVSSGVAYWIFSKGGYLMCTLAWAYPAHFMVVSGPWLLYHYEKVTWTCRTLYNLTATPVRCLQKMFRK